MGIQAVTAVNRIATLIPPKINASEAKGRIRILFVFFIFIFCAMVGPNNSGPKRAIPTIISVVSNELLYVRTNAYPWNQLVIC